MNLGDGKSKDLSLDIGGAHATRTFVWDGIHWTLHSLMSRLLWVAVGLAWPSWRLSSSIALIRRESGSGKRNSRTNEVQ
jgi:hypothetical protein